MVGDDVVDGAPVWIIEGTPHPGFKPKSKTAAYFVKMQGRNVDRESDYRIVKIDAVTMDTIWIGAFLIRFAKGGHIGV